MGIVNNLKKQVDLPVWEWCRLVPQASGQSTAGLVVTCCADNSQIEERIGRYWYKFHSGTVFYRYDTITDTWQQLSAPPNAPATASSMRFSGALGYYNRVIAATSTTISTGLPSGQAAVGFRIQIVSGTGAGQERIITAVSDPIVVDSGISSGGSSTTLIDASKSWFGNITTVNGGTSNGYTGAAANFNSYAGYVVRTLPYGAYASTAPQARKILYHNQTTLAIGDPNLQAIEPFCNSIWTSPVATTPYQIELSTITVDTAWDVTPDLSSRFVIKSGGILLMSGAAATPFYTMQYYDVLHDAWYTMPALQNIFQAAPTDLSLERCSENNTVWYAGKATSGTTTTLYDANATWKLNEYAGYELVIISGTGRTQVTPITSNTETTLTFTTLATAPDSTSYYQIAGYDGGTSSGSNAYNTLIDSSKSFTTDRFANYGVRIVGGTGIGQLRQIASNTGTTLTIYGNWNVLPDNTSKYIIGTFPETMYMAWGGSGQIALHNGGVGQMSSMASFGRVRHAGTACVLAALPCSSTHTIFEQPAIPITSMTGTTTITATTSINHNLRVGQYVSIRGVTSAAADQYNVTGAVQVTGTPSATTFTYTPSVAGSGTYAGLTALATTNLSDASKDFRDNVSSSTTTSVTFTRATPSNINGWYITGTNVLPGTRVTSGAGTVTLTIPTQSLAPTGVLIFSPYGPSTVVSSTYSSGGGSGVATITMNASTNANINGWLITGNGIAPNTFVTSGAGTAALVLSNAMTGAASGTYNFYPPDVAGKLLVASTAAPSTTGSTTSTTGFINACLTGTVQFLAAITLPVAGTTRYVITDVNMIGARNDGQSPSVAYGVASAGAAGSLTDANLAWAGTTGTGSAQGTVITLVATAPGNINGWYVTGTGISAGTRVVSGAGTTSITVDVPFNGAVSGTMTFCALGPNAGTSVLTGKRIKILSGTAANSEVILTGTTNASGVFTFATVTPAANSVYSVLSMPVKGAGIELAWIANNNTVATKGRYMWMPRSGNLVGWDKLDLCTDKIIHVSTSPNFDPITTGAYLAYDGHEKLYYSIAAAASVPTRLMYIDTDTGFVYGAGTLPYTSGTAQIGNRLDIFDTFDGLMYIITHRPANLEVFRSLLYW